MSNMEFENESRSQSYLYSKLKASNESPAIIKFLIKHGIVKSENAADVLVVLLCIIVIAVSILIYSTDFMGIIINSGRELPKEINLKQ